jgi:CubicO group peptidase (beta-lactamase class C family)
MKQKIQTIRALALVLVLSLSLAVPASAAEAAKGSTVEITAEKAVSSVMEYGQATQASWAVWQDGEIISSGSRKAELDTNGARKEGEGDVYCIGSVSKMFTTVAVMQLAEAGKLNLDQPVVKYLPAFKMADPRYKDITVRMLLNHSSGLMGSSFSSALLFNDASRQATGQLLERLSTQRLKADPGAYSVYCNDGFTLAELVVEAVTDMNFEDYLHAKVFDPAGLEETWSPDGSFENRRAAIYGQGVEAPLPKECLGVVGAGGLYATAEDLAVFGGALTDGTLLKKASRDAMAAPEYAKGLWPQENYPSALAFGLGWDHMEWYPFAQNGITALVKGGDTGYYHAGLVVLPEQKMAAAVLSAGGVSTYNEMAASQMLIAALREKNVEVSEIRFKLPAAKRADLPKELLDSAGYYGSQMVFEVKLEEDGTLTMGYLDMPGVPDRSFYYHDDGTFRDEGGTSALRIVKEKNGQTYLYQWTFTGLSGLGYLPGSNYAAMKLPENPIDPALQASWEEQMGKTVFLPANERYSSQVYLALGTALKELEDTPETDSVPGYIGNLRIDDETHASYVAQVPGNAGRDGYDVELRKDEKGALWMYYSNGTVGMDLNAVPVLSTGKDNAAACTIQPNGYARWYKVGDNAAGKTMAVQVPKDAGFWVYDAKGNVAASSVLWDSSSVKLEEGGLIVFAGNPGARFELTFQ